MSMLTVDRATVERLVRSALKQHLEGNGRANGQPGKPRWSSGDWHREWTLRSFGSCRPGRVSIRFAP